MRTGVSTIRPLLASTSNYCVAPTAAVMLFGRVSWFFEVSLASMAVANLESKESLPHATNAGSSSAPNNLPMSRRWRYGANESACFEFTFGLAASGIEGHNRIRILRRERNEKECDADPFRLEEYALYF
jgi:hypothetical protein